MLRFFTFVKIFHYEYYFLYYRMLQYSNRMLLNEKRLQQKQIYRLPESYARNYSDDRQLFF